MAVEWYQPMELRPLMTTYVPSHLPRKRSHQKANRMRYGIRSLNPNFGVGAISIFWQPSPKFLGSSPPFGSRIGFHASYFSASKSALTAETLKRSLSFCCTRVRLFAMPMQPEHHKRVSVRIKSEASMILQQWARGFSKLNALAKLKHQSIMLHVLRNKIEQVKPPRIFKRIPSADHIGCPQTKPTDGTCWIAPRFVANPPLQESVDILHWPQDMELPENRLYPQEGRGKMMINHMIHMIGYGSNSFKRLI